MTDLPGTPGDLHRIAAHIRSSAAHVRDQAQRLAVAAGDTRWHSPAAHRFHDEIRAAMHQMYASADRLDHAAHAYDRHARRVHEALSAPVHVARAIGHLVGL